MIGVTGIKWDQTAEVLFFIIAVTTVLFGCQEYKVRAVRHTGQAHNLNFFVGTAQKLLIGRYR